MIRITSLGRSVARKRRPGAVAFIMTLLILVFGFYFIYPVFLVLLNSFNTAGVGQPASYSTANWSIAFRDPILFCALRNTVLIYFLYTGIAFPVAIVVAWLLARTRMPFSHGLEFVFWISYMLPTLATTIGWIMLMDPRVGLLNDLLERLPFVDKGFFNLYSVPGIVWAHLMSNAISQKVMLLTPAFRNMDAALEEAAAVSGASKIMTMMRVTLPVMMPAIVLVTMLNVIRIFQSFDIEMVLGRPIGFFVYSTQIFEYVRVFQPSRYGEATALASVTLVLIAVLIPLQRWLIHRKRYTTITGQFRPGLLDLGRGQPVALVLVVFLGFILTALPVGVLVGGSFMTRLGFFEATPPFTFNHWEIVFSQPAFWRAVRTTIVLGLSTAVISPLLFSLIAYVLVMTRWPGRTVLDSMFWVSSAIPGILAGLGLLWLFLGTPLLKPLFGTIYALLLVTILQGNLISVQLTKVAYLQLGSDMGEAARIAGAGWFRTYLKIWLPLIAPTLVLVATLNFIFAVGSTSTIILLADLETRTLSLMLLAFFRHPSGPALEQAGIVSLFLILLTVTVAVVARKFGLPLGVRHS